MVVTATAAVDLPSVMQTVLLVMAAFGAAVLSAVTGFGGGVLLLAVCIAVLGPRNAVVVVTIAQLASNGGRAWFNRAEIDYRLAGVFCIGAVPGAVGGALLLISTPVDILARIIGGFLLAMVLWRHLSPATARVPVPVFVGVGAVAGVGSGLLGSLGPLVAQLFLARGLVRGAYIGTDAAATLIMHVTKLVVYAVTAVLNATNLLVGLVLAPSSIAGSWAGKQIVDRISATVFVLIVELALVTFGIALLIGGEL
ncbi:sulfite exporter TauE/SafE family protein [Thermomonospora echinospora]|uniref:sulfite exporter TauE/SafE family protein n=1 Tax=Thermomonospora echinospora TaxID=1992 RepID=UPI00190E9026|nr:sulfite exporter TauE/SafE family protein [Thermomonospora echinospora]